MYLSLAQLSSGQMIELATIVCGGSPWPLGEWPDCRNDGRADSLGALH